MNSLHDTALKICTVALNQCTVLNQNNSEKVYATIVSFLFSVPLQSVGLGAELISNNKTLLII